MRMALGLLCLVCWGLVPTGCQDYGSRSGTCKGLDCRAECTADADCAWGDVCVVTHDGCCSHCELDPCESDADCPACQACDPDSGECLATPCGPECFDDSDCEPNQVCRTDADGCCYHCVPADRCADLDCLATCAVDEDCPPEALCHVYEDGCCSMCVLADQEVLLTPTCVHAPSLVGAGGEFPLAVYGSPGCGWFDRVEVTAAGFDIQVDIIGRASADPDCPPLADCAQQDWSYIGLIWLPAPNPGAYTVTVSGGPQVVVGASGGIVEEPVCQDDCTWPALDEYPWTWRYLSAQAVTGSCGAHRNVDRPASFEGACQDYTFLAEGWPLPAQVRHCQDGWVTFGPGPLFRAEASACWTDVLDWPPLLLGIGWVGDEGEQQAQAFLIEGW